MSLNEHSPVVLDKFNGLWMRNDLDDVPLDHLSEANNLRGVGTKGFGTRYGIGVSQNVEVPLSNVRRIYNYPTPTGNTLIVLVINDDDEGEIYHVVSSTSVFGPLLTLEGMVDFAFQPYAGRGYISPIGYYTQTTLEGVLNIEKGLENEFLYVYMGAGSAARKAAGAAPTGNMTIANGAAGHTDAGTHLFGVVFEYDSGYLSPPGALEAFTTSSNLSVSFTVIPTTADPNVTKRHLVATRVITDYDGNLTGYQYYFIPDGTINDNVTTFLLNVSFFDADLIADASYLFENFEEIPAFVGLTMYKNRLIGYTTFDDISIGYASTPGEPEAMNQITGLLVVPPDGNPLTNAQELRDVLYMFKRARTVAFVDNGDVPATWPMTIIDLALGTSIHGIATVLDSGSVSVDMLIVCTYKGMCLFTGTYIDPELSWKVNQLWVEQDQNEYRRIQLVNEPISKQILMILPDLSMLIGDYTNGMNPKNIKWWPWSWVRNINTVAIVNIDDIIFGMDLL